MSEMDFAGPIRGGSASINGAEFWICPVCHACVMESRSDDYHRREHLGWHEALERIIAREAGR